MSKIMLNGVSDVPLNKLILSQANVRRIKAGVSIENLAEDIARRGLIQSLSVRPVLDGEGQETGMYEVPAGGRRFEALKLLAKQKRLSKTVRVPCIVRNGGIAEEDSLAENTMREALHPLDQFRAFLALRDEHGMGDDEIAARFFVTPAVVRQRLRLTSVSPVLLELYAEDAISLEQLMAFTVSGDHARQEQVWEAVSRGYNKEPYLIRRMMTEGKVSAAERCAVFIGAEAYEAAGGSVARDLFNQDHGGWFEDAAVLDRLVDEKLQAEAAIIIAEGWRWVEIARDFPYGHNQGLRRVFPKVVPLTDAEQTQLDALREEMARIEAEHAETGEDLPEEVDRRLAELEREIAALDERPGHFEADAIACCGAYVSLGHEGRVRIERGYMRQEDELSVEPSSKDGETTGFGGEHGIDAVGSVQRAVITIGAGSAASGTPPADEDDSDPGKPLSERLVTELTAQRTLALREALANDPDVAFVAVLHALALRAFYGQQSYNPGSCLEIDVKSAAFSGAQVGSVHLADSSAAQALARQHDNWGRQLPTKPSELWDWLLDLDTDSRSALFAYCAARTLNATHQPYDRRPAALAHATRIAEALALDMSGQWSATKEGYLGRVTKAQIIAAVREAKGEAAAQLIDHLKKGDMAEAAERVLAGTGWLPALLRTPGLQTFVVAGVADAVTTSGEDPAANELPAFLTGQDEGEAGEVGDAEWVYAVAAE